jgi:hypothetical protein
MRGLVFAASLCSLFACGNSGNSGPDAAAFTGEKYALTWGPVTVHPGEENTQCITVRLSNANEIKVHRMHNKLSAGSHHLILYKDDMDTTEVTTPVNCQPFTGALNLSGMVAPVMITQKDDDELTLPDGVGYTLKANQMIRIEMHYINSTDADLVVTGTSEFYEGTPGTITDEANILFIGSPDIDIAPNSMATVEEFFTPSRAQLDLTEAKFFAITGHTHQYGTNVTVDTAPTSGGARTSIYAPSPFSWSEPETTIHKPEFKIPAGGGFNFKCEYNNTSNARVKFGESATAEMCFFWAYYYPSKGAHVCVHSTTYGNIDICCPDAGAQLCNMLNQ